MLSASEESLFRSIEKRAKDPPGHVYRYHPVDLVILLAFVISVLLVFVGFYYFEIRFPLGGLFWHALGEEAANATAGNETATSAAPVNGSENATTGATDDSVKPNVLRQVASRGQIPRFERSVERAACNDRSCKALSHYILESLKPSADPCGNFYEFVCGQWSQRGSLRPGEAIVTEDSLRAKAIEELLIAKLKERSTRVRAEGGGGGDPLLEDLEDESLRWTLKAFANCRSGVRTTRKAFRNILEHQGLQGFPFRRDPYRVAELAGSVARLSGVSPFVKVSLDPDKRDGRHVVRLSPSEQLMFKDFWTVSSSHEKWYGAAAAKASSGVPLPTLFNVEKKLTELAANSQGGPVLLKLSDLNSFNKWNWKEFLMALFQDVANITRNTYVRIESDAFAKGLASLLRAFRTRDIANFLGFKVHLKYAPLLEKMRLLAFISAASHPGWNESLTRDLVCLRMIADVEPYVLTFLHWDMFKASLEPSVVENIVQNAKNTILNFIEGLGWLQPSFKSAYEDRLQNTTCKYLVPFWLTSEDKRLQYTRAVVDHVHYSGINTFHPVVQGVERNRLRAITESGFDVSWESRLTETEPVWATEDTLEFPMGLFSRAYEGDAFWIYHLPRAGVKVVSALLAALVDTAKASDRAVFARLLSTKDCLEQHYMRMPESQTPEQLLTARALRDVVLENMALPLALALFRSYVSPSSGVRLEGLADYSPDQLFYINYALGRCEAVDSRYSWQRLRYGRAPPAAYRVNGPLRNDPEFARAFSCAKGSYMNPSRKCDAWAGG